MSHFSTVKTKITDKDALLEALQVMGHTPNVPFSGCETVELVITNPDHREDHPVTEVDISIGVDIGFRLNKSTGTYELVADLQTWNQDIPIKRYMDKLTQQYARMVIHSSIKEKGFVVEEEWEMDDNSIELNVVKWN